MTLISVIIPAYNQGHYLAQAIESVLAQTLGEFEIIVVDDGSTDNTSAVATSFDDPRIRVIYQDNAGLSAARNTGLRLARGAYITLLDSDDAFLPEKLARLRGALEAHPEWGFVAGPALLMDETGRVLPQRFETPPPRPLSRLLLGNPFHVGAVMIRRAWLDRVGEFDVALRSYEDWDMWLRLALAGCEMGWVETPVSLYRFHTGQMTRNPEQMTAASFAVLDKVFRQPQLPPEWANLRDAAYGNAHLRAAAQSYLNRRYDEGAAHLEQAVALRPELVAEEARPLEKHILAWAQLPKVGDPLTFLADVYDHLPPSLGALARRKTATLSQTAMDMAFGAYARGDMDTARRASWRAFRLRPTWVRNRGAVALLLRSMWTTHFPQPSLQLSK
jgi:glycosyltransferase involved in cell wall biosynthesis